MKTRCFIAINLPDDIKKEISFLMEKLKQKNPDKNIKWVKPEGIHLTLHFLGYLDEEKIEQVKKIIQESVIGVAPTEVKLKDFGGFPDLNRPRVFFVSGEESGGVLRKLQTKIGQELEKIGLETDRRPWQIHLTLARLKIPMKFSIFPPALLRKAKRAGNFQFSNLSFEVKSIDLMKSELTPIGAKYSILESFPL